MSTKRTKTTRTPRGVQKWILAELGSLGASVSLSSSKIEKRIAKSSGKKYHTASVYLALRNLVDRGDIKAVRMGQEKAYHIARPPDGGARESPLTGEVAGMQVSPKPGGSLEQPTYPDLGGHASTLPHKLALGEILVLRIEGGQVLTASNLHGRLVLERHPFPP